MLSHMPTVEVKHKLVVQQRINRQMAKKLKTLAAERSLDEIELNVRQCTIKKFAEQINCMRELAVTYSANRSVTKNNKNEDVKIISVDQQKFIECAPYSDVDSNVSLMCDKT
ncbi:PREDICTED: uncharacterized protein LOC108620599 [Drosophila arizonae]|uniref:Uncharacterized protein LOC108620599 n=1 Tax=Drosophila arizonae TaxID=7263 RepID=A0ABM1Q0K4_DROAR|nr:PREDICTED: uncharacterized protein LOC108620599 [Drosophila arizonae]